MQRTLELLSLGLAFGSIGPYVWSIIFGPTRPHRTTWFVWLCVNITGLFVYYNAPHATQQTTGLLYASAGIPAVVFLLSLWKGEGGTFSPREKICLAGAALGGVTWFLFGATTIGLLAHAGAHYAGSVMTIEKAWDQPRSENLTSWSMSTSSWIIAVAITTTWSFPESITTIYMTGINILVTGILIFRRMNLNKRIV